MGFRPFRLNPDIYEACPPLRWGGAHTSSHHSGVWCAGRATPSGGGSRPDGLATGGVRTDHLTALVAGNGHCP